MMSGNSNITRLPEKLGVAVAVLGDRVRKVAHVKGFATFLACLAASWIILFSIDRLWDTPVTARIIIASLGWSGALAAALSWYNGGVILPKSDIRLAKLARDRFGGPGDRFLGVLELSRQPLDESNHSEALFKAAAKRVEEEVSALEITEAIDLRPAKRSLACFGATTLVALVCVSALPDISLNALQRWLQPWADHPRLTLAQVESCPETIYCLRGEPLVVRCALAENSRRNPNLATLASKDGQKISSVRNGSIYEFSLPGQFDIQDWEFTVGDAVESIKIIPMESSRIERLDALVALPEYLNYPNEQRSVEGVRISVPYGARLSLDGFVDRKLGRVSVRSGSRNFPVTIKATHFRTSLGEVTKKVDLMLRFTDEYGLPGNLPRQVTIQPVEDEAPRVSFEGLTGETAILESETFPIKVKATDDFGVSELELNLSVETAEGNSHKQERLSSKVEDSPAAKTLELPFPFDPSFLGLKAGDVATLTAKALDRHPEREPVLSQEVFLYIVGPEEHAEAVRRKMEDILAQVSEIAREEEAILMENIKLEDEAFDELDERKSDRALNDLSESQRDNARNLREAADEGAEALREALRNPLFEEETLKDWSETMKKMEEVASREMAQAARSIEEARANPSQSEQSLSEAEQSERDALENLREILTEANQQLDKLEALTLAQRLRQVQKTEDRLGEVLVSLLPDTIGQKSKALDENQLKTQEELENTQNDTYEEADLLQGEISRFHERTGREKYGEVGRLMEEEGAAEGIREGSGLINRNVSFAALDLLDHWSERFKEWADMLEEEEEGGGGGGQGGGEQKDMTEQLIALLRVREKQVAILDNTNFLAKAPDAEVQKERSELLSKDQRELMTDLTGVQVDMEIAELNPLFDDAHTSMANSAEGLEKNDWSKTTTMEQRKARDIVSDIINLLIESSRSNSEQSSNSESQAMQFLLMQLAGSQPGQGLGMTPGMTGGGSKQGGDTDQVHENNNVDGGGKASNDRKIQRASGASGTPPQEFRRALENYFRQIEQ